MKQALKSSLISLSLIGLLVTTSSVFDSAYAADSHQVERPVGLFDIYKANRDKGLANYITEDFVLLSYSLVNRAASNEIEDDLVRPLFNDFLTGLAEELKQQNTERSIVCRNNDYLTLLLSLLAGDSSSLDSVALKEEYGLVESAAGIQASPMLGYRLDYGQFKPRGRYTESEELIRYFRAMRYAGAALFPVKGSMATGVSQQVADQMTESAMVIVDVINTDPKLKQQRAQLENLLSWRYGAADDLTDGDLLAVWDLKAESKPDAAALAAALLEFARTSNRQPRIHSGIVEVDKLEPGVSTEDVLTGWRLIPSRYNSEGAIFQRFVFNQTGQFLGDRCAEEKPFGLSVDPSHGLVKGYPAANELMAVLGGLRAGETLQATGENCFEGYVEAFKDARKIAGKATGYNGEILKFLSLAQGNLKKSDSRLTALLAFWTLERYQNVLYAKQSYTPTGKGMPSLEDRGGAVLEPSTALYTALARMVEKQIETSASDIWKKYSRLLNRIIEISFRSGQGVELSKQDNDFLNKFDKYVFALTQVIDRPIIVDVHVNTAERTVVEEATGYPEQIKLGTAVGGRLSHHEFKWPMEQRLNDEEWREQLQSTSSQ